LTFLAVGFSPSQFVIISAIVSGLSFAVLFIDSRKIAPTFSLAVKGISLRRVKPYIVPGLGHAGMPLIHALQNQGVLLVLGGTLGSVPVAIFQTARVLINGIKSILKLFPSAFVIEIPRLLGLEKISIVKNLLVRNSQVGYIFVLFSVILMVWQGDSVYRLWLGPGVNYPSGLVTILLFSLFPFVLGHSFIVYLQAINKIHLAVVPIIIIAIISLISLGPTTRLYGLVGAGAIVIIWEVGVLAVVAYVASVNNIKLPEYFYESLRFDYLLKDLKRMWIT
jgi:O-antigen/teichoic acid export membrane protein